jgi:putative cardiolipin synthase
MYSGERLSRAGAPRILIAATGVLVGAALWLRRSSRRAPVSMPTASAPAGRSLRETFESLPDCGGGPASLRVFSDNNESWIERWRLLASARSTIDVSYFILHEDVFGLSFLGHLLERARAGVEVRILVDSVGTKMSREFAGNGFLEVMASLPNVKIATYRPLWRRWMEALATLTPSRLITSEHDKMIVVDGRSSLIGGRNIASEYFSDPSSKPEAFRDMDVRIDSPGVADALRRAFESQLDCGRCVVMTKTSDEARQPELLGVYRAMDDWLAGRTPDESACDGPWLEQLQQNPQLQGAMSKPASDAVDAETRIVDSPGRFNSPDDPITQALMQLVAAADEEIFLQTPYVVLSETGLQLLEEAGRRGVAITILTNSPASSDNALSQAFFLEQWPEMLARIPTLRMFVAGDEHTRHGKSVTFDGRLAMVGTYNLDPVSMACNSEVMAASWSRELVRLVELPARRAIEHGEPDVFEYRIRRTPDGRPVLDDKGKVAIEFGACDHCTPAEWTALTACWSTVRAARDFTGFSPFF